MEITFSISIMDILIILCLIIILFYTMRRIDRNRDRIKHLAEESLTLRESNTQMLEKLIKLEISHVQLHTLLEENLKMIQEMLRTHDTDIDMLKTLRK